ncbi:hypothetical protein PLESTB_001742800 [Pleodorina starrii]|uniref:JmjC domain-containing protein n=1 Tax=Pleodorina starrii TaxID=330485 RepID=A0A9W6F9E9_9CHLO|nr:hypothetical protein PLESTB_001742800 [Pleodorina starrii]
MINASSTSCQPSKFAEAFGDDERERKIRKVKRAVRSELSTSKGDWYRNACAQSDICSTTGIEDRIPRVHWKDLTPEEFAERFERPRIPVVITGLADDWPAFRDWTPERLRQLYGEHKFKVGSDDEGYAVRMPFAWYLDYMFDPLHGGRDDSPLYIFDGTFADREGSKPLRKDYEVPEYFREDLFRLVGEKRRPPYRWLVLGPARSGSGLHIDPLATSAWNTLLAGRKRWALFPPGTPRCHVLPKEQGIEREAVSWFSKVYPRATRSDWPTARVVDLVQAPGETVFVPGGWWHAVLNLDATVAVTQNYVSTANFERVWKHTRKGRPKMSLKWLAALERERPDLAALAHDVEDRGEVECNTGSSSSSSSSSSSEGSSDSGGSTCTNKRSGEAVTSQIIKRVRADGDGIEKPNCR